MNKYIIKNEVTNQSLFGKTSEAQNCIRYAYTKGPATKGDYFHTLKWAEVSEVII